MSRISAISGLDNLTKLQKLDLGKNLLTSVSNVQHLVALTQISLEDNSISSTRGLEALSNLMELYMGNNQIPDLKSVLALKELPKLLILDLSGNPVCELEEYRLYTIYHLRKLKVLDGTGIDAAEYNQAKETYSGKVTEDLLGEILGHKYYAAMENVDLSSCRIRVVDLITAERFTHLRSLILDNNSIADVTMFSPLRHLRVLRLNRNRIAQIPDNGNETAGFLAKCFPKLEVLELGYNKIISIANLHLRGLKELKVLTLENNDIVKVDGLSMLPALQQLVLAKNKIKRIDPLSFKDLNMLRGLQVYFMFVYVFTIYPFITHTYCTLLC